MSINFLGREYRATIEGEFRVLFRCRNCAFESIARVRSRGMGTGRSPLFLSNVAAKSEAAREAQQSARQTAGRLARFGRCPKCRQIDLVGLERYRKLKTATVVVVFGGLGGGLLVVLFRSIPLELEFLLAVGLVILVGVVRAQVSQFWAEAPSRVAVMSEAELRSEAEPQAQCVHQGPSLLT